MSSILTPDPPSAGGYFASVSNRGRRSMKGALKIAFDKQQTPVWSELGIGNNQNGQLSDNTQINRSVPTPAFHISGIKTVACGETHTLALDSRGVVWALGWNAFGQLGTGDFTPRSQPVKVITDIKAIAAEAGFSLVLSDEGVLYGCGRNGFGQLGVHDNNDRSQLTWISGGVRHGGRRSPHTGAVWR